MKLLDKNLANTKAFSLEVEIILPVIREEKIFRRRLERNPKKLLVLFLEFLFPVTID